LSIEFVLEIAILALVRLSTITFVLLVSISCAFHGLAGSGKVIKVLPHYLDRQGRHALYPSLYDRDAYQAQLRRNPEERSTLRFDVQWKAKGEIAGPLKLRLELRCSKIAKPWVLEEPVKRQSSFSHWSILKVAESEYRQLGELIAWKASLWDGSELLAEQKSFLWQG
jgi:hypothetical protein